MSITNGCCFCCFLLQALCLLGFSVLSDSRMRDKCNFANYCLEIHSDFMVPAWLSARRALGIQAYGWMALKLIGAPAFSVARIGFLVDNGASYSIESLIA
jgi:hypothetical protein